MKRANRKRKAETFERAYGGTDRVLFVKSLPCSVLGCGNHPSENAHVGVDHGMGRKGDADTIIPLCEAHHKEYHAAGRDSFATKYRVDYSYHAHLTEMAWSMVDPEAK